MPGEELRGLNLA
jgi:hypothetical protein